MRRNFLRDLLTKLVERRGSGSGPSDERTLEELCSALLDAEGEVSGVAIAQTILDRFSKMASVERLSFYQYMNTALEIDINELETAVQDFRNTGNFRDYKRIAKSAEPRRQELLRRLNQPPGATQTLVDMRTDFLTVLHENPELARIDMDFQHLLKSWFNRGFLLLRQISWDSPASILEKIVQYEAVHAIGDWQELRRRLYPKDRRCFAFFHPSMPDEPLIFVEVALTMNVPNSIQHVLSEEREQRDITETKVAVFYSISNCQQGLKGVSFGNLLIKQVVAELRQELPQLETFVTLSPIPKLNAWLSSQNVETNGEPQTLSRLKTEQEARTAATEYLLNAKTSSGAPYDPVARFHLGNGAQIYAVHAGADLSDNGIRQSGGAMVNYQYDITQIERNHEKFIQTGEVSLAPAFRDARLKTKEANL